MAERCSDLLLERYRLGELDERERAQVERSLQTDPELTRRLAALQAEDERFEQMHPPSQVLPRLQRRLDEEPVRPTPLAPKGPRWASAWLAPCLALGLLAALVPLWYASGPRYATGSTPNNEGRLAPTGLRPEVRFKGSDELSCYRQAGGEVHRLTNGQPVRSGARLQLSYLSTGARGFVFSIDSLGTVTWHLPVQRPDLKSEAPTLVQGTRTLLRESYELDDTPGAEHFFLVTGAPPLRAGLILEAVDRFARGSSRSAADLAARLPGCSVSSLTLVKAP